MRQRKAFTMIEMLIVVGVILILMGLAIAAYTKLVNSTAAKSTGSALNLCQSILAEYEQSASLSGLGGQPVSPINQPLDVYLRTDNRFPYPAGYRVDSSLFPDPRQAPIGVGTPVIGGIVTGGVVDPANDTRYPPMKYLPGYDYIVQDPGTPTNAVYNTAAVMMYMMRAPQVRQIVSSIPPKSILQNGGQPIFLLFGNEHADAPVLLDGWGNPIIYVPPGGLVVNIKQAGGGVAPALIRSSGITSPFTTPPPLKSSDRPFWASAGSDGNFATGDDNVYSFQQQ